MSDARLSSKLVRRDYGEMVLHEHWCPGCRMVHQIAVEQPFRNGARWSWNGNAEAPTFTPSIRILGTRTGGGDFSICHYFIRAGRIEFCPDSRHSLAGQTVDLPDMPADEVDDIP